MKFRYTLQELEAMPTLCVGQAGNLKVDDGNIRVWLSRCDVASGEPYDNKVTVEMYDDSGDGWSPHRSYQAQ